MPGQVVVLKVQFYDTPLVAGGYSVPVAERSAGEPVRLVSPVVATGGVIQLDERVSFIVGWQRHAGVATEVLKRLRPLLECVIVRGAESGVVVEVEILQHRQVRQTAREFSGELIVVDIDPFQLIKVAELQGQFA